MVSGFEETTTGVHRLIQMEEEGKLLFQAIASTIPSRGQIRQRYGCRHSLVDGIKRLGVDPGKVAMVCGYGDVGKGSADSLANEMARVMVSEIDPTALTSMYVGLPRLR